MWPQEFMTATGEAGEVGGKGQRMEKIIHVTVTQVGGRDKGEEGLSAMYPNLS